MEKSMKLSAPWVKYYKEVNALFVRDPHVQVMFDEEAYTIKLYVEGSIKAEALEKLLSSEKEFGNVTVKTEVIPANPTHNPLELFKATFEGNPAFSYAVQKGGPLNDFKYVVFEPEIVQFFDDSLSDVNGYCTTLYQEIAKDVFKVDGVYFCTREV